MIYEAGALSGQDLEVLARIEALREELRFHLREPRRWYGTLRRATMARALQGSNSIEGYHASVEDVAALMEGEEPLGLDEETRQAIAGYRDAMTYVLQLTAAGASVLLDESLLRSLHFMMLKYDLNKHPGQWRPASIWVEDEAGRVVCTAPERSALEPLIRETLDQLNTSGGPTMIRAAMAHLNLVLVHPFSDGNGRMARCLQSFVLAADGVLSPEFLSIEEYLGRNTAAYYEALTAMAEGTWSPKRSAASWVRFSLVAHFRQAHTVLRRIREFEALWNGCDRLVTKHRLPERSIGALCDAARGWKLQRSLYVKLARSASGEPISEETGTRDLKALADAGLLSPIGEKRGRRYERSDVLAEVWNQIRAQRAARSEIDPYAADQPRLPGF